MAMDFGIASMGIFAFIFVVAFAGLVAVVPPAYMASQPNYANPSNQIPSSWNGQDLTQYNFSKTWNTTLSSGFHTNSFGDLGRNLYLFTTASPYRHLGLAHRYGFGLMFYEYMNWFDKNGKKQSYDSGGSAILDYSHLDNVYTYDNSLVFKVICEGKGGTVAGNSAYFYVTAIFSFNSTKYDKPSVAWANGELQLLLGIDSANTNYSKDLWYLISMVLTFQTYNVFGSTDSIAIMLNLLIASMIYAPAIIFGVLIVKEIFSNWL